MTELVFKGGMPAFYDRYLGAITFAPYAAEIAGRVAALTPQRILETACGTGILTLAMAECLPPTAQIVATDLSQPMVDFAAAKRGDPRITWRQADAQDLPFADTVFDLVVCQFGIMFLPDKRKGLREACRVLRPGGRFVFTSWDGLDHNALPQTAVAAIAALFPADPPSFMQRVPYGYHDRATIAAQLKSAGFFRDCHRDGDEDTHCAERA
jgi:ubiquinone/menaquinone biosynthesis C-methylase UbiE